MAAIAGGCLCGGVRYTVSADPQPLIACHCKQCQRMSGSYFVATAVPRDAFTLDAGDTLVWLNSSETSRRGFCGRCGSSLFFDHGPEEPIGISAGSLDDHQPLDIAAHIYVDEANTRLLPDDGAARFSASEWRKGGWNRLRKAEPARTPPSPPPALRLHHINHVADDVERLRRFYADVMGLGVQEEDLPVREATRDYAGNVVFLTDGNIQMHLAERDLGLSYRAGKAVNPVERGHVAFRTDDIGAFRRRLDEMGVPYADYAGVATGSWHQIFFHDPEGNVVEVHQVLGEEGD
ncbi:MAG: GFA family protein [Rhizobiaceae bacterium]